MPEEKKYWLDSSANVTKLYRGLWCVGIVLLLVDVFLHKHEDFTLAGWLGFYGFYGFLACVALVITAKALRRVLMRSEDYYER
jgi:hypothetical protein